MSFQPYPRLIIAGTGGDCGKTLVALSLAAHWRRTGLAVAAFKKGPDYIDSAWLGWASGRPARNLDTFMVDPGWVKRSFFLNSRGADISLIEGNRGLYDGMDALGTHSTAQLAKLLDAPVILVINAAKITRTAAALTMGMQKLDREVKIEGVIFNQVAGERHQNILRTSVETICGVPAVGFIPRMEDQSFLPGRHLGLVPPEEHPDTDKLEKKLSEIAVKYLDTGLMLVIARKSPPPDKEIVEFPKPKAVHPKVRICYFADSAFTFYYPDNFEALEAAGAELEAFSALNETALPPADALFIGGGFPETHLKKLSDNRALASSVKKAADSGMPIYAECGGLIYLCESLKHTDGKEYPLAGVLPLKLKMERKPQGHGYSRVRVDRENPFFPLGTILKGHEFHYTCVISGREKVDTVYAVERGSGSFDHRDGIVYKNVLASYVHLHALGTPEWAKYFVAAAKEWRDGGRVF